MLWPYLTHHGLLPYVVKKKWNQYLNSSYQAGELSSTVLSHYCESYEIFDEGECDFISDLCFHHIQNSQVTLKLGAHQIQILVVPLLGYICPFITLPSFSSCVKWWKYYVEGLLCRVNERICRRGLSFDRYSINIQLVPHLFNPVRQLSTFSVQSVDGILKDTLQGQMPATLEQDVSGTKSTKWKPLLNVYCESVSNDDII